MNLRKDIEKREKREAAKANRSQALAALSPWCRDPAQKGSWIAENVQLLLEADQILADNTVRLEKALVEIEVLRAELRALKLTRKTP